MTKSIIINKKGNVSLEKHQFPRAYSHIIDGIKHSVITQPYITGLYVAIMPENSKETIQMGMKYKDLPKTIKKLRKDKNILNLVIEDITDYLDESSLEILNL